MPVSRNLLCCFLAAAANFIQSQANAPYEHLFADVPCNCKQANPSDLNTSNLQKFQPNLDRYGGNAAAGHDFAASEYDNSTV
jgi:hypothetical protein